MSASYHCETSSLFLREFVPADAAAVFRLSQETGMRDWIPDQVYRDEENALEVLSYLIEMYSAPGGPVNAPFVLAVCSKTDQKLIGHVGLSPADTDVEIGYAIGPEFQGRGCASEAVTAMSELGLLRFGLSKILGIVHSDNIGSCKVLERCGYVLREEKPGRLHDRGGLIRRYELDRKG